MTAIIILNWNGYRDTLACLESLFACVRQDFVWMVVDNGSSDGSVQEIATWLKNSGHKFLQVHEGEMPQTGLSQGQGVLYSLKENYGFAKGNNTGIALVEQLAFNEGSQKPSHYLLLNNDTLVEPDFLVKLESFAENHPQYVALSPQIRYAEPKNIVWNCGGRMKFGLRKYIYGERDIKNIRRKEFIEINLITGCALFVARDLLGFPDDWLRRTSETYSQMPYSDTEETDLLTNRFFFGEEDFDFSLRLQESRQKMACVLNSVIYHKLGSTRKNFIKLEQVYIHYLNRFIDIRQHWRNAFKFFCWQALYFPYIVYIFYKSGAGSLGSSIKKSAQIIRHSKGLETVSRETFLSYTGKK